MLYVGSGGLSAPPGHSSFVTSLQAGQAAAGRGSPYPVALVIRELPQTQNAVCLLHTRSLRLRFSLGFSCHLAPYFQWGLVVASLVARQWAQRPSISRLDPSLTAQSLAPQRHQTDIATPRATPC